MNDEELKVIDFSHACDCDYSHQRKIEALSTLFYATLPKQKWTPTLSKYKTNFVIAYVVDVIMCTNRYIMCYMMGMKIKCNKGECSQKSKFGKIIIFGQMHINMSKKVILSRPLHQS